jgi:hypothetical protein
LITTYSTAKKERYLQMKTENKNKEREKGSGCPINQVTLVAVH